MRLSHTLKSPPKEQSNGPNPKLAVAPRCGHKIGKMNLSGCLSIFLKFMIQIGHKRCINSRSCWFEYSGVITMMVTAATERERRAR